MSTWKGIIGVRFTPATFDQYCHLLPWLAWRPGFIVLHNTAIPTLAQRPTGLSKEHLRGLERSYRDEQYWSAGPHRFIDDRQIWVFTPLGLSGGHSPGWNKRAPGVEMPGDFATEAFDTGRGAQVQANAVAARASLLAVLGLDPATLRLHKEDPKTTHHCPGTHISKARVIEQGRDLLAERHAGEHLAASVA